MCREGASVSLMGSFNCRFALFTVILTQLNACFTPAKERRLNDEIFNLRTRVMQLENALTDENTPAGEAAKRRLASTATEIERMSSEIRRLRGDMDALKVGITTGFLPGVEGDQTTSVGGKLRVLDERLAALEAAQSSVQDNLPASPQSDPRQISKPASAKKVETPKGSQKSLTSVTQFRSALKKRQFKKIIDDAPDAAKAAKKSRDRDEIRYLHAEALYKLGQMREAALQFNDFIDSKPGTKFLPQARLRMGDAFRNLGDPTTAKIYYQELIDKHPKSSEAGKAKDRLKELGKSSKAGH